jgi:Concanavalin A-like lectin/glucanases superfamily/SprB repeat/Secretion system C-terminal sorting domain
MRQYVLLILVLIFFQFTVEAQVPSYVSTNGLVGWWPFNGNANDVSGNGHNGLVYRATLTNDRSGKSDSAYQFDFVGSSFGQQNKEIYIPYSPSFNSSSLTVSVWVKPRQYYWDGNPNEASVVIHRYEQGYSIPNGQSWGIRFTENVVMGFIADGNNPQNASNVVQNTPLELNQWVHLSLTYNGQTVRLYRNGILVDSNNSGLSLNTLGTSGISIGVSRQANGFWGEANADIDDIGIWNRALTQSEITALYQAAVPVTASASTVSNVSCFNGANGSATVTPNGGTPPYSYSWNSNPVQTTQTATGLKAGVYTVTVTDSKGAMTTANATVTQPTAITNVIASTVTNVSCFGGNNGSVTVSNPTGGTPPYTYSWNTSPAQVIQTASNLVAGTYVVTVTDSKGCIATSSATVNQPAQALSNIIGQTVQNVKCNGTATGIVSVSNPVGGTPPYSYKWNTNPFQNTQLATNVPAGVYTVTVTDNNGCIATAVATVTEPTKITNVQASVVKNVQCRGEANGSATVTDPRGGTPPYTYQWNTFPVQNTQTAINLKVGTYIVTVSDSMGCQTETAVSISQPDAPLSITNPKVEQHITCYGLSDGIISIQPAGGTPPYVIVWNTQPVSYSNRLIGVPAGVYTAVVIDANACKVETTLTVKQPTKVLLTSPKDTTVLIQTKAELEASTNNPASNYTWQSNIGIGYQNLQNVFQYSGVETTKLTIDNVTLANHNQPFRCIIETNGCYDTTAIAILTVRTNVGIDEQGDSPSMLVYPNPTGESDELLIQLGNIESQLLNIELLDIMGISRAYSTINVQAGAYPIRVSGLAKGMYTLRVHTSSGIMTEKVIIN